MQEISGTLITSCPSGEHKLHADATGISSEQETIAF